MSADDIGTLAADEDPKIDVWERLAKRRDALEMCVKEDVPFASRAEKLLERLDEEGY